MPKSTSINLLAKRESERQRAIALARDYHEGNQGVKLTPRLEQFIVSYNRGHEFNLNVCRAVVSALSGRLSIMGFDSVNADLVEWAKKVWDANLMGAVQDDVHEDAIRDGEHFIIVDWDTIKERPRWTPHTRFVSVEEGGDDFGCIATYEQNDPNMEMLYVTKYWVEMEGNAPRRFKTIYYPERIEKYKMGDNGEWQRRNDPRDPINTLTGEPQWPTPWVDGAEEPIGIPVVHFKNRKLRCEAWDAFPIQDAINKELLDLLLAGDQTAFRIYVALGFIPTTDGLEPKADRSNWQQVEPGEVVASTKSPQEASFDAIKGEDLTPLQNLVHQLIMWLAMVTETPVTRFTTTKLIASDETLKEQEIPLLERVEVRQTVFGEAWVKCLNISRRLEGLWGDATIDQETPIKVLWKDAKVQGEKEKLENLKSKKELSVPVTQLWKEAGYDQLTIVAMQKEISDANKVKESGTQNQGVQGSEAGTQGQGQGQGSNKAGTQAQGQKQR